MNPVNPLRGEATAHPSLALIKYWGKSDSGKNLPATPSLAVTLDKMITRTTVELHEISRNVIPEDRVEIDGRLQTGNRFESFFSVFRTYVRAKNGPGYPFSIRAKSSSDFPSAAGLASSASGFAALTLACVRAAGIPFDPSEMSALARVGSASAARSIWGGYTRLEAGAESAEPLFDEHWWPELRIIVVELEKGAKAVSSRDAMERTRSSSPFYSQWLKDAPGLMSEATRALEDRNLKVLGPLIRKSYLRMFGTMFAADPPIIYWKPESIEVIRACETMRDDGLDVWETMDAGPQVKLITLEGWVPAILTGLRKLEDRASFRVCSPGGPALAL